MKAPSGGPTTWPWHPHGQRWQSWGNLVSAWEGCPFWEKNMGSLSAAKMGDVMAILAIDDKWLNHQTWWKMVVYPANIVILLVGDIWLSILNYNVTGRWCLNRTGIELSNSDRFWTYVDWSIINSAMVVSQAQTMMLCYVYSRICGDTPLVIC